MSNNTKATGRKNPSLEKCKFCGGLVNLEDEGNQYPDGTAAHEGCADSSEWGRANFADFAD